MTISQRAVRGNRAPGIAGGLYDISALNDETYFVNAFPQKKQKDTIKVSSNAASTKYQFEIDGVPVVFESPATGNTAANTAQGLADALNSNPMIRSGVVATVSSDVITLESALPGLKYTATESDTNLGSVTSVETAAEADAIGFGLLCFRNGTNTDTYDNRQGRLASSSGLTQREIVLTITSTATVSLQIGDVLMSETGVIGALVTAFDGKNGITATNSGADLTLKAPLGTQMNILGLASAVVDSEVQGDNIDDLALGISRRTYDEEATYKTGLVGYPGNAGVSALRRGKIWVENSEVPSEGDTVYVGLTGGEAGKLFASAGSGRAPLSRDRCRFVKSRAADGLAVVECNFF